LINSTSICESIPNCRLSVRVTCDTNSHQTTFLCLVVGACPSNCEEFKSSILYETIFYPLGSARVSFFAFYTPFYLGNFDSNLLSQGKRDPKFPQFPSIADTALILFNPVWLYQCHMLFLHASTSYPGRLATPQRALYIGLWDEGRATA
jgi:hypothetical protein